MRVKLRVEWWRSIFREHSPSEGPGHWWLPLVTTKKREQESRIVNTGEQAPPLSGTPSTTNRVTGAHPVTDPSSPLLLSSSSPSLPLTSPASPTPEQSTKEDTSVLARAEPSRSDSAPPDHPPTCPDTSESTEAPVSSPESLVVPPVVVVTSPEEESSVPSTHQQRLPVSGNRFLSPPKLPGKKKKRSKSSTSPASVGDASFKQTPTSSTFLLPQTHPPTEPESSGDNQVSESHESHSPPFVAPEANKDVDSDKHPAQRADNPPPVGIVQQGKLALIHPLRLDILLTWVQNSPDQLKRRVQSTQKLNPVNVS